MAQESHVLRTSSVLELVARAAMHDIQAPDEQHPKHDQWKHKVTAWTDARRHQKSHSVFKEQVVSDFCSPASLPFSNLSQNTTSAKKYGLVVTDVFTRESVTRAHADTVARAAAEAIPDLVQDEGDCVVTTHEGNEFRTVEFGETGA